MIVAELVASLDSVVPLSQAAAWDPVGLQIGDLHGDVGQVAVCHEVSAVTVAEASSAGIGTLISYHPLLFHPTTTIVSGPSAEGSAIDLIRAGINLIVVHTAFDVARPGTGDALLEALGFPPAETTFGPADDEGGGDIGRISQLAQPISVDECTATIHSALGVTPNVTRNVADPLGHIGVVPGSGGSFIADAIGSVDCVITGDVSHHEARAAVAEGVVIIDVGHVPSERPGVEALYALVRNVDEDAMLLVDDPHPWRT